MHNFKLISWVMTGFCNFKVQKCPAVFFQGCFYQLQFRSMGAFKKCSFFSRALLRKSPQTCIALTKYGIAVWPSLTSWPWWLWNGCVHRNLTDTLRCPRHDSCTFVDSFSSEMVVMHGEAQWQIVKIYHWPGLWGHSVIQRSTKFGFVRYVFHGFQMQSKFCIPAE